MRNFKNQFVTRFYGMLDEPELSELKRVRFVHKEYTATFKKEALKIYLEFVRNTYARPTSNDDYSDNGGALTPRETHVLDAIAQLEDALKADEDSGSGSGAGSFDFPPPSPTRRRKDHPDNKDDGYSR